MKNRWQKKTLADVCTVDKCQGIHQCLPYVGLEHIESNTGRFLGSPEPLGVKSSTFKFSSEHVLYGRLRPYLNKVMLPDFAGHCSTEIFPLKPRPELSREFLQYWFLKNTTVKQIDATSTGARMPRANMNAVLDFEFLLPPLPEQKHIVAILDEAFAGIATTVANTEKNLASARELFESYLNSKLIRNDASWRRCRLGSIVERLTNGYVGPTRNIYIEAGIPYLLARHVKDNCLAFDGKTFISDEFNQKNKKSTLKAGDVLLVQSGHIGHSAVVPKSHEGHNCHAMIVITPVADRLAGNFLSLFFNSPEMRKRFTEIRSGSTVPHLTCRAVKELKVPVPDLSTQQKLVNDIQELQTETRQLEALYQHKLTTLADLKQSLLHKAFSGALTSQSVSALQEAVA